MITYLYLLIHAVILRNDDNNETPNKQFNSTMRGWTWSSCGSTAWSTGDGGDGGVAVQGVTVRAGVDDGGPLLTSPHRGGNCLFAAAEAVAAVSTELGEERGDVLRGGYGETGGAAAGVAEQGRAANIDAADRLRPERVLLALAVVGGEAQCEVLHGKSSSPQATSVFPT